MLNGLNFGDVRDVWQIILALSLWNEIWESVKFKKVTDSKIFFSFEKICDHFSSAYASHATSGVVNVAFTYFKWDPPSDDVVAIF